MNNIQAEYVETDFHKWYANSQCANSSKLSHQLKAVITRKESLYGFLFRLEKTDQEDFYFLTEKYNPLVLRLTKFSCSEFLDFIDTQYAFEEIVEENKVPESNIQDAKTLKRKDHRLLTENINKTALLLDKLKKISSVNKAKHAFIYSLITFIILQINILPGNISSHKLSDWGIYFFFGILFLIYYISIWTYSRLFRDIRTYNEIFKLTALFCSFFFLLVFIEITIIDMFGAQFIIWWNLFLIFIGQILGIFLSLFLTMLTYFIKGGKMINMQQ